MFEQFTDQARRVLVLATEEARLLGHRLLGPEHILLGLLQAEPGIAAEALAAGGVTLESARSKVAEIAGRGDAETRNPARFTPQAKKVLELSLREALQLGDTHIDTEHVLLATLRSSDGIVALTLASVGAGAFMVRHNMMRLRAGIEVTDQPVDRPEVATPGGWYLSGPRCPNCQSRLDGHLIYCDLTAAPAHPGVESDPVLVRFVFCGHCGVTLAPALETRDSADRPAGDVAPAGGIGSQGPLRHRRAGESYLPEPGGPVPGLSFPSDLWDALPPRNGPTTAAVDVAHRGRFEPDGSLNGTVAGVPVSLTLRLPWPSSTVVGHFGASPVHLAWDIAHDNQDHLGLTVTLNGTLGPTRVDLTGWFRRGRGDSFADAGIRGTLADTDLAASIEPVSSPLGHPSAVVATGTLARRPFELYVASRSREGRVRGSYDDHPVHLDLVVTDKPGGRITGSCPAPPPFTLLLIAALTYFT